MSIKFDGITEDVHKQNRKTIPLEACKFTEFKSLRESDQLKYVSKLLTMIQGGRGVEELDTQELTRFERIGRYSEGS